MTSGNQMPCGNSCAAGCNHSRPPGVILPHSTSALLRRMVAILSRGPEDEFLLLDMLGLM